MRRHLHSTLPGYEPLHPEMTHVAECPADGAVGVHVSGVMVSRKYKIVSSIFLSVNSIVDSISSLYPGL